MASISHKVSVISLLFLFEMSLLVYCATANNKTNQPSYKMHPPPFCYGGLPGTHGKPGSPGVPGRDGRDGREGAKGDQGSPGKTGPQGPPGPSGTRGAKGESGVQGPPGQKGQRGESGASLIPGTPGAMSYKNWKECAWKNLNDDKDHGLIKDCMFTKNFSDTALRVYWSGDFRIYGCDSCCKRWYFTFNGAECAAPLPIDGIVYMYQGSGKSPHRVRHIEGHCNNIHKGRVRVGFWVGNCAGYGSVDAHTGWNSVSRIFVEEVPKPQA
ncbi:collagen triple helix repeat-containing protein 1-like [Oculina patagonica]